MVDNSNLGTLAAHIEQHIAELEESLLVTFSYGVVRIVNDLYTLRENLRWGGQIVPAEPREVGIDNIHIVEDTVNTVIRQLQRAKLEE